jgi:hypothetical protein
MYYPAQTTIAPLVTIRRERLLPARGQVLVRPGEMVGPADVVARCQVAGEIRVVDVRQALKVRRERADRTLRKAAGDAVQAGEVLAAPRGLLGRLRRCRAPMDGHVLAARNGMVLIEALPTTFELRAHMKGQIANIMPDRGVVISTVGTLIQGVWGSGGEAEGVLNMLVDSPQKPIRARSIDVSCRGTLVVGGRILDEETLKQAVETKVRGIVAGSASAGLRPALAALPFPVVLTEGFGTQSMSQQAFSLLQSHVGREAILNADTQTRWDVKRPEVIVPLRSDEEKTPEMPGPVPLETGMKVRATRAPHAGALGTVTHLPVQPQRVESGARLPVAEVDLEGEGPVLIPLANLELLR